MALNIFNYRYQQIPYVTTKGIGASNIIVPSSNRPSTNKDYTTNPDEYAGPSGKARPLKQWRLQLNNNTRTSNKASIATLIDRPGQSISLATDITDCQACLDGSSNFVKQYIIKDFVIQTPIPSDKFNDIIKFHIINFNNNFSKWIFMKFFKCIVIKI